MNQNEEQDQAESGNGSDGPDRDDLGDVRNNIKERSIWLRLLFMIIVGLLYGVSRAVVVAVVIVQFFWVLFTAQTNPRLQHFGESLATYTYQIVRYLTFNTERRPFPFDADWPNGPPQI